MSGALFTSLLVLVLCVPILGLAHAWGRYLARPPPWVGEAEQKALDLLKQWLSSVQLAQYERTGRFDVTGCHSGKHYRIRHGPQMNIYELDQNECRSPSGASGLRGAFPSATLWWHRRSRSRPMSMQRSRWRTGADRPRLACSQLLPTRVFSLGGRPAGSPRCCGVFYVQNQSRRKR